MGRPHVAGCMSVSEYEYHTESGCLSVKLHLVDKDQEEDEMGPTNMLPYPGVSEIKDKSELVRSVLAEIVGTLLLVLVGCGSCMGGDEFEAGVQIDDQSNVVRISFCFGLTVATIAQAIGHISGGHINPAVTFGLIIGRKIGIIKGALYMIAQCVGAIFGAAILRFSVPEKMRGADTLGVTVLGRGVTASQAVATEMVITMVLLLVIFGAAADSVNSKTVKGSAPLAIGLSVAACHLYAVPLTGASMNPARSLGPALITGNFRRHWVYWAGPFLGAFLAAIFYQAVLRARVRNRWEDQEKRENRKSQCWKDNEFRDDESPPYVKNTEPAPVTSFSVIATQESDGKEMVWLENPR